jgi:hypothetical protein
MLQPGAVPGGAGSAAAGPRQAALRSLEELAATVSTHLKASEAPAPAAGKGGKGAAAAAAAAQGQAALVALRREEGSLGQQAEMVSLLQL